MNKIKKLNISLFPDNHKAEYKKDKMKYIAGCETYVSGFLTSGYVKDPVVNEARWNEKYPNGYLDWAINDKRLNSVGQQNVIDKINEIVEIINK